MFNGIAVEKQKTREGTLRTRQIIKPLKTHLISPMAKAIRVNR